eukprot:122777_1
MTDSITCHKPFRQCEAASRIKSVLCEYDKIIADKTEKSYCELQNKTTELLNKNILNGQYSDIKLFNDLYHIKYDHNTNDDGNQFNLFHEYLTDNNHILKCDASSCLSVQRYYTQRDRSLISLNNMNINDNTKDAYSLNLICRIHTYFIHSHETSQLNNDEIHYIEQQLNEVKEDTDDIFKDNKLQLISTIIHNKKQKSSRIIPFKNNSKYITTDHQNIDYDKILSILNENDITIEKEAFEIAFDYYGYHRQMLIDDLCDILLNENDDGIVLKEIFLQKLHQNDANQRQNLYNIIFYEYVQKQDLNNGNFMKILKLTISKLYPDMNYNEIEAIAIKENLTGKLFVKQTNEFKNSKQFGLIFKTITAWDKKQWQTIYKTIHKWKQLSILIPNNVNNNDVLEEIKDKDDWKLDEEKQVDYIDKGTDIDIIHSFCAIANTEKNVAFAFLKYSQWNVNMAVNKYYALNGDITKLDANYTNDIHDNNNVVDDGDEEAIIYEHGVKFWYWSIQHSNQRYITKKFDTLKDEIRNFKMFPVQLWNELNSECNVLLQVDRIKQIVSNGNNTDIYAIKSGDPLTLNHLISIKLYTDFSSLCDVFCKAFRLRKITEHQYERIQSLETRNSKIANWCRLLIEAVQAYGKLRTNNVRYYRGLTLEFMFPRFVTRYNVPLSTTTDFIKAAEFAQRNGNGLIMELKVYNEFVSALNTSPISIFPEEKEVLFFGSNSILRIGSMFQWYDNKWSSYRNYINGIQNILNISNGAMTWNKINDIKDIIGFILPTLYDNNKILPPYVQSLLKYHLNHLPNKIEYDFI